MEDVSFDNDTAYSQLKLVIRNSGGVTAQIQTLYVYDGDTRILKKDGIDYAIAAGETREIGFTEASSWVSTHLSTPEDSVISDLEWTIGFELSHAYTVRLVTDNGFAIEGTYYSPGSW